MLYILLITFYLALTLIRTDTLHPWSRVICCMQAKLLVGKTELHGRSFQNKPIYLMTAQQREKQLEFDSFIISAPFAGEQYLESATIV